MSGAEFIVVAGVISSIIAIVDGIKQVVEAADEAEDLPQAFLEASRKLPIISDILEAAKHKIEADNFPSVEKSVTLVVNSCQEKWITLNDLFEKVVSEDKASRLKRYYMAVKTLGEGSKVENLMKGMFEDILLLVSIKTMTMTNEERVVQIVTAAQEEKVMKAITDIEAWLSSVPDEVFQEGSYTNNNFGAGQQYIAQGGAEQNNFQGDSRQYHSGGGSQIFNESQTIINITKDLQNSKRDEAENCLSALFLTYPRDDRETLIAAKGRRVDNTCEWIKTNSLYKSWLCSHSQLLWLSGGPGKGKTMLSIFLAEELERMVEDWPDACFLQYFCDYKDDKRNTAMAIIRGMIFQLLQIRPKLIDDILPSFQIQKESLFTDSSFQTLWRIFEKMLRNPSIGTVYWVLDGLDECDSASLKELLRRIAALFSPKLNEALVCTLHLIVVSRDHPDFIPEILSNFPRIRLDSDVAEEFESDIHRFIDAKINELSIRRQYPAPLCRQIQKTFQDRAQGSFLWVGIVAHQLRKYKAAEVEQSLDIFPRGQEELYARLLQQIDIHRRDTAARILLWVVTAIRPLTLAELHAATNVNPPVGIVSWHEVITDQISYCGHLLKITGDKVGLIHQSAKAYLSRKTTDPNPDLEFFRVKEKEANLEISKKCLDYLQQNGNVKGEKVDLKDIEHSKAFPLFSYAAFYWPRHARSLSWSEDVFDLSKPFYQRNSSSRESWLNTCWPMKIPYHPPTSFTLLHLASCFGILPLVEAILHEQSWFEKVMRRFDLNKWDSFGGTALYWAARGGHEAIVHLLLEQGADFNVRDNFGWSIFDWVDQYGHKTVRQLLLEKTTERRGLHRASLVGDRITIQQLLEQGADVTARDKYRRTALHLAAIGGHNAVAWLLLEKGADTTAKDKNGQTALHLAAWEGHNTTAQLLLEKGADATAKNNSGQTALHLAAWGGHNTVAQLLLEKGADAAAKDNHGRTALHWAAHEGHKTIAQLLLEKGADALAKDNYGRTALHWAAHEGHKTIAQLLLEKGADTAVKGTTLGSLGRA